MVSSTYLDMASFPSYSVPAAPVSTLAAKPVSVCAPAGSQGGQQGSVHKAGASSQNCNGGEAEDTAAGDTASEQPDGRYNCPREREGMLVALAYAPLPCADPTRSMSHLAPCFQRFKYGATSAC